MESMGRKLPMVAAFLTILMVALTGRLAFFHLLHGSRIIGAFLLTLSIAQAFWLKNKRPAAYWISSVQLMIMLLGRTIEIWGDPEAGNPTRYDVTPFRPGFWVLMISIIGFCTASWTCYRTAKGSNYE